jgi:hypothetical protein
MVFIVIQLKVQEYTFRSLYMINSTGARGTDHSPFSNFLITNLFSIKFLYFFIISSLFPHFNLFVSIFIQSYVNIKLHVSTLYRIHSFSCVYMKKYGIVNYILVQSWLLYLDNGWGHRLSLIEIILYIWQLLSRRLIIIIRMFKIIAFFIITLLIFDFGIVPTVRYFFIFYFIFFILLYR